MQIEWRNIKMHRNIWSEDLKERGHFEDMGIYERTILKRILKIKVDLFVPGRGLMLD
jgi:hypothetical protein